MPYGTTWQGKYRVQQNAPSLWHRLSLVVPSLLLHHACSSWGNLATSECPLWESCHWWASCSLQPTRPACPMLAQQSSRWTYSSEPPAALTKFTGRSGDVLLVAMSDHPIFHYLIRRWHAQTRRQPTMYTVERHFHESATMLASEPFIFLLSTCSAEHASHSHVLNTSSHPMTWLVHLVW